MAYLGGSILAHTWFDSCPRGGSILAHTPGSILALGWFDSCPPIDLKSLIFNKSLSKKLDRKTRLPFCEHQDATLGFLLKSAKERAR